MYSKFSEHGYRMTRVDCLNTETMPTKHTHTYQKQSEIQIKNYQNVLRVGALAQANQERPVSVNN